MTYFYLGEKSIYIFGTIVPETGACEAAMTRVGACVASNQIRGPVDFVASSQMWRWPRSFCKVHVSG